MIERTDSYLAYTGPKPAMRKQRGGMSYGDLPREELQFYTSQTILSGEALEVAKELACITLPTDKNPNDYQNSLETSLQNKLRNPEGSSLSSDRSSPLGFFEVSRLCMRAAYLSKSAWQLPRVDLCNQLTQLQAVKPVSRLARAALYFSPEQIQAQQHFLRTTQNLNGDPEFTTKQIGAHTHEMFITRYSNFPAEN